MGWGERQEKMINNCAISWWMMHDASCLTVDGWMDNMQVRMGNGKAGKVKKNPWFNRER